MSNMTNHASLKTHLRSVHMYLGEISKHIVIANLIQSTKILFGYQQIRILWNTSFEMQFLRKQGTPAVWKYTKKHAIEIQMEDWHCFALKYICISNTNWLDEYESRLPYETNSALLYSTGWTSSGVYANSLLWGNTQGCITMPKERSLCMCFLGHC